MSNKNELWKANYMGHVKVVSKTIRDNTGLINKLPVLLVEQRGVITPLWSLHEYFISNKVRSDSRRIKLIQIVGLLLDYMDANANCFSTPLRFFESFTEAIYSGTIDEEGYDHSGLYWLPKRIQNGRDLLYLLNEYSDWMHDKYGTVQLNPWRKATRYEERLNWAALINKSNKSFLGHLDSALEMTETAKKARSVVQKRTPSGARGPAKVFPEDRIHDLLWEGFKVRDKKNRLNFVDKYNWRDIAITILLHGG